MMNENSRIPVGVLGATGYTGRELLRLLAGHSEVRIAFATSESEAGTPIRRLGRNLPEMDLVKSADAPLNEVEVVFSCLPHGDSARWVEKILAAGAKAIDLSNDLRVISESTPVWGTHAVYGLPELHRAEIANADLVANPGCYPTAAILSIAPLARRGLIGQGAVIINAASGVTGAGRTPKRELLFGEVSEDYRAYGVGNLHRHLAEMIDQVTKVSSGAAPELVFTPHLLPVPRGILATTYIPLTQPLTGAEARAIFDEDYASEPFVDVLQEGTPNLSSIVRTNYVSIGIAPLAGVTAPMMVVIAAVDNLVKGAAGQALQNLNIMQGWTETEGLL
jgi:N-acetyl-gamma-glutamyl-phosphate reductase